MRLRRFVKRAALTLLVLAAALAIWLAWIFRERAPAMDEAMAAGLTPADFPHASNDHFREMDGGGPMTPEEVRGRNTWMVWTGGNQAFWDHLAGHSFGTFDLLKTLSSYPCSDQQRRELQQARAGDPRRPLPQYQLYRRSKRFRTLGLMNEPGFVEAVQPDEFGLCLDRTDQPPDFDERVYGRSSGVLGLRLYPNPAFDQAARDRWMANKSRYYTDPVYFSDSTLVRPYRVGMACSFCHVSHHPLHPPVDPENPRFANLSGTIGAQYFWFGRVFSPNLTPENFIWHLVDGSQPGAIDTSFVPQDNINNPRAVNAVFDLPARLAIAGRLHQETAAGGALHLPEVKAVKQRTGGTTFPTARVLWDGADSVGLDAALTRVYINIGEYHQQWIRHLTPLVGARPQSPIKVEVAQKYSTYWNATQERSADLARYLVRASAPMPLAAAPGGEAALRGGRSPAEHQATLARGQVVFADTCARCHSSKLPAPAPGLDEGPACQGERYLDCWDRYWRWTETEDFKSRMRAMVRAPDFLAGNYLSSDARIPVTLLETEICSAMASNAVAGKIWDNFSSQSYKSLPGVGVVKLHDPVAGKDFAWPTPDGGRGYQRVPSLVSIWATAPFLHNNEVGAYTGDPSVAGRLAAYHDGMRKLLWLEPRGQRVRRTRAVAEGDYGEAGPGGPCPGESSLSIYTSALSPGLRFPFGDSALARGLRWLVGAGSLVRDGAIEIGPIPAGTPINLIANLNLDPSDPRFTLGGMWGLVRESRKLFRKAEGLDCRQSAAAMAQLAPRLRALSTCPDFIVDRGHDFGRHLSAADKEALIELLKTF